MQMTKGDRYKLPSTCYMMAINGGNGLPKYPS